MNYYYRRFSNLHVDTQSYLPASRTKAVLVSADTVPAETADLVATGAGKEVNVIDLQGFHAERALHWILFHLRATGHPMARCSKWRRDFTAVKTGHDTNRGKMRGITFI